MVPDTSKSWAGQATKQALQNVRTAETRFRLVPLRNGSSGLELRVWTLASSYDPQTLHIINFPQNRAGEHRTISYSFRDDSVWSDMRHVLLQPQLADLDIPSLWNLKSQSDLKSGDSFGCMDGSDLFIELADSARHKFMWYRCPNINKNKDSVFAKAFSLGVQLHRLKAGGAQ
jgi:hypothetical protein